MKQYVFALIKKDEKILMLKRPKDKKVYAHYWNFPGGKIEDGETDVQCVIREVEEETGMKFKPSVKIMDSIDEDREPKRVAVFLGDARGLITLNNEHDEWGWFKSDELRNLPVSTLLCSSLCPAMLDFTSASIYAPTIAVAWLIPSSTLVDDLFK